MNFGASGRLMITIFLFNSADLRSRLNEMNVFYRGFMRKNSVVVSLFLLFLILSLSTSVFAAKPVKAPIEEFYKDRYIIAEFKARAQAEDGAVTLDKVADIWGDAQKTEVLRFPKRESVDIEPGEHYIVVYSYLRKHLLYRDVIEENPNGPAIVHGLAGAAIYRANDALRFLFRYPQADETDISSSEIIDAIFVQLQDEINTRERRLAVFQFMLSSDLHKQLSQKQAKTYRRLLRSQVLPDLEQELLLTAARGLPVKQRKKWLVKLCRQTVDAAGSEYDLTSLKPIKIRTCVRIIGDHVEEKDTERLTALLYSNAPGVSKAALSALVAWDNRRALAIFHHVLQMDKPLQAETHRVLVAKINERG